MTSLHHSAPASRQYPPNTPDAWKQSKCPQCGDPTYLEGWPCDGCWHQQQAAVAELERAGETVAVGP